MSKPILTKHGHSIWDPILAILQGLLFAGFVIGAIFLTHWLGYQDGKSDAANSAQVVTVPAEDNCYLTIVNGKITYAQNCAFDGHNTSDYLTTEGHLTIVTTPTSSH